MSAFFHGLLTFIGLVARFPIGMVAFPAVGALIPEGVSPDPRGNAKGGCDRAFSIRMMFSSFARGAMVREIWFSNTLVIVAMVNVAAKGLFQLMSGRVHVGWLVL